MVSAGISDSPSCGSRFPCFACPSGGKSGSRNPKIDSNTHDLNSSSF